MGIEVQWTELETVLKTDVSVEGDAVRKLLPDIKDSMSEIPTSSLLFIESENSWEAVVGISIKCEIFNVHFVYFRPNKLSASLIQKIHQKLCDKGIDEGVMNMACIIPHFNFLAPVHTWIKSIATNSVVCTLAEHEATHYLVPLDQLEVADLP